MSAKLKAVIEVSVMGTAFFILAWYFESLLGVEYGFYSKAAMILLGLFGIAFHKKPREYGLIPKSIEFSLKWSVYTVAIFMPASMLVTSISLITGSLNPFSPNELFDRLIWFFVFTGFAEELFFRGYVQSRLNEVFSKKYEKILWVDYKWSQGTLITGLLFFGLPHMLSAINPLTGRSSFSLLTIVTVFFACFLGVVLGVLREKTGGILLPTMLHGLTDFTVFGIGKLVGLTLSMAAMAFSFFLFFALAFEDILRESL